jgi:hypothetical protein
MNGQCSECGQRFAYTEHDPGADVDSLCVACFLAWLRLGGTKVTFSDLDEPLFDPPLDAAWPELADRVRARADLCRLPYE